MIGLIIGTRKFTSVHLAAGFNPAATRVMLGRRMARVEGYPNKLNRIPEGEQARREATGR